MRVSFLPVARTELENTLAWYEEQVVGLGYDFLDEFDQSVHLIASYPDLYEMAGTGIRRCLVNRFPYAIFYGIDDDRIVIVAVAHLKRQPAYWIDRVQKDKSP